MPVILNMRLTSTDTLGETTLIDPFFYYLLPPKSILIFCINCKKYGLAFYLDLSPSSSPRSLLRLTYSITENLPRVILLQAALILLISIYRMKSLAFSTLAKPSLSRILQFQPLADNLFTSMSFRGVPSGFVESNFISP